MKIEGYVGICADCFAPVPDKELFRFREDGRNFHKRCAEVRPDSYYAKLEKRLAKKSRRSS